MKITDQPSRGRLSLFLKQFEVFLQTFSLLAINAEIPWKYPTHVVRWSDGQFFLRRASNLNRIFNYILTFGDRWHIFNWPSDHPTIPQYFSWKSLLCAYGRSWHVLLRKFTFPGDVDTSLGLGQLVGWSVFFTNGEFVIIAVFIYHVFRSFRFGYF